MRKALFVLMVAAAACGGGSFTNVTGGPDAGGNPDAGGGPVSTAVIQSFTAPSASITLGQTLQLTATFTGGTGVIDHQVGAVQSGVPVTVSPTESTTYTLVVTDPANVPVTSAVTVLVNGPTCIGNSLLTGLGKTHMLAGVSPSIALKSTTPLSAAELATWDANYVYLAGGVAAGNGNAPCTVCDSTCTNGGWWGCYNTKQVGDYARFRISDSKSLGQIPWFTYYEILQSSGFDENTEVSKLSDPTLTTKILADMRFLFQTIGTETAFVHVEPDFWGFAQHLNSDPTKIPVALSGFADCETDAPNLAGFVKCIIGMARKYSPNVRIGFHGSPFATGPDVSLNTDPTLDVAAEGIKLANFMKALGADQADFIAVDASDRDAGYYKTVKSRNTAWDATNVTLPNFHQSFTWVQALAEGLNLPVFYWQVPVGNSAQNNTTNHYVDNRVDYFYAHPAELAAAHVAGVMFGAGAGDQTLPEGDGGNLVAKQKAYVASGGQAVCH